MLKQIFIVTGLGLRSIRHRFWQSLVIVAGMVCVIGVLLSMLSLVEGMRRAYRNTAGDPRNVLVLAKGSQFENGNIPIGQARILLNAPGVAKAADGSALADPMFVTGVPGLSKQSGTRAFMPIRGIGAKGRALNPNLRLTAGRMFRPGSRELIAGIRTQERLRNAGLGDKVTMPDGQWEIVGLFEAGDLMDGMLVCDVETLMRTMRRNAYNSVLVRLESPAAFDGFRRWVTGNPALALDVQRLPDWLARMDDNSQKFFRVVIYGISLILAIGALFGCINTMYAAVDARKQEIATLRALGYGGLAIAASVLLEAALLCVLGALIGAAIAWCLYDGVHSGMGVNMFDLAVSPAMVGLGLLWALGVAVLGGILPSIRAARWTVADALRAR